MKWISFLFIGACTVHRPIGLYPSTRPGAESIVLGDAVTQRDCVTYALNFIPLGEHKPLREIVDDAKGEYDALIEVALSEEMNRRLLSTEHCYVLSGIKVNVQGAPYRRESTSDGRGNTGRSSTPGAVNAQDFAEEDEEEAAAVPSLSSSGPPPATAYRLAEMVYRELGRKKPESEAAWNAEVKVVWAYANAGKDANAILEAARRGAKSTSSGAPLSEILAAGFGSGSP